MHRVVEEISENNNWRDGEFARYKTESLNVDETLWCRMCVPMIYAHWEGFVIDALRIMLTHLNQLKLKPDQIPSNLVVISLGNNFSSLSGKQSFQQKIDFTCKFNRLLFEDVKFKTRVDTKSNLKSNVFKELCEMFGFEYECFSDVFKNIDRLVNVRNSIAHGENSILPDIDNIKTYIESVQVAMDMLLSNIDSYLNDEKYLLSAV